VAGGKLNAASKQAIFGFRGLAGDNSNAFKGNDLGRSMVITDHFDHNIDDKGRLAISSTLRAAAEQSGFGQNFYLVPEGRYLQLIPEKLFERLVSQSPAGLMPSAKIAKARRYLFSNTTLLTPDAQGRVTIPERFMIDAKHKDPLARPMLSRQVTLVGAVDRIELWNRADYYAHMRELEADKSSLQDDLLAMFGNAPATSPTLTMPPPTAQNSPDSSGMNPGGMTAGGGERAE